MPLLVLNLSHGTWQHGFPSVTAQLWPDDRPQPIQFSGSLPPMPTLAACYQHWRQLYQALHINWRQAPALAFEIDETDLTHLSETEFADLSRALQRELNTWLNAAEFSHVDRQLRTYLSPTDEIRLVILAEDPQVLRFPWNLWSFLEDYPQAEIALSPPEFARSTPNLPARLPGRVTILAVLGNASGIDVETDRQLLQQLPQAQVTVLVEPTARELHQHLWQPGWDLLFFAGHSTTEARGYLQLNATERLSLDQLRYGLRQAIAQGLKLAIFNSCDGLGLAQDLADLHLPQVIVMREAVPDRIAQEFLKQFLVAFTGGNSLYRSVREARERLQAWESEFPCASWLPVICQNPAEGSPLWSDWVGRSAPLPLPTRRDWQLLLLKSLLVMGLVAGVRWLGWLQPLEFWAFDCLMQLRPSEAQDDRLLVITVTEADIQAQGNLPRLGSLSDRTLTRLLDALEPHQPRAIGLDIYRDFPAEAALAQRLRQRNRVISICKRPDAADDPKGILPPPEVPTARIGFSDFVQDPDSAIRRHLLFLSPNATSACTPAYAFSTQLAFRHLAAAGIWPQFTPDRNLQLGQTVFHRLGDRSSAYQPTDARGAQLLLNYRAAPTPQAIAQQATLTQLLNGQVNPNAIKDRVVLVGITNPNQGDYWTTPYGSEFSTKLPGVLIHAQMVSQLLSAVYDRRPLLTVWPLAVELIWLLGWATIGSILGWLSARKRTLVLLGLVAMGALTGPSLILLIQGYWVPLVPAIGSLLLTMIVAKQKTHD